MRQKRLSLTFLGVIKLQKNEREEYSRKFPKWDQKLKKILQLASTPHLRITGGGSGLQTRHEEPAPELS